MFVWRWLHETPLTNPVERKLAPLLQLVLIALAVTLILSSVERILRTGILTLPPGPTLLLLFVRV